VVASLHSVVALGDQPVPTLARTAAIATLIMAALVLLYTGMEVMVVRARPLWSTPILPLQFAATVLVGAAGLVLVLDRSFGDRDDAAVARAARPWLMAGLVATFVLGLGWLALGLSGLEPTHARALASVADHRAWQLTALWLAVTIVLPLVLLALKPTGLGWLIGLLALHAAWMFRWAVFIGGQTVPKNGAGLYDYHLPLGHDGLTGIAGTAGLWLAVLVIVIVLMPSQSRTAASSPALAPAE
jgi:tetrathionate reductase subunit C